MEIVRYLVEGAPEELRVPANIQDGQVLIRAAIQGQLEVVRHVLKGSHGFTEDQFTRAIEVAENDEIISWLEGYQNELKFTPK